MHTNWALIGYGNYMYLYYEVRRTWFQSFEIYSVWLKFKYVLLQATLSARPTHVMQNSKACYSAPSSPSNTAPIHGYVVTLQKYWKGKIMEILRGRVTMGIIILRKQGSDCQSDSSIIWRSIVRPCYTRQHEIRCAWDF